MADDDMRQRLRLAIQRSATEAWSPWYVLGHVPDEDADLYADAALRRWRSRGRRSLGRRDPVLDLAKGFIESPVLHAPGEGPISDGEKQDYRALGAALAGVLRDA